MVSSRLTGKQARRSDLVLTNHTRGSKPNNRQQLLCSGQLSWRNFFRHCTNEIGLLQFSFNYDAHLKCAFWTRKLARISPLYIKKRLSHLFGTQCVPQVKKICSKSQIHRGTTRLQIQQGFPSTRLGPLDNSPRHNNTVPPRQHTSSCPPQDLIST